MYTTTTPCSPNADRFRTASLALCAALAVGVLAGCSSSRASDGVPDAEIQQQIDKLRQAVSPFYSFDVAMAAGWDAALSGCVEHPELGGMGYHYGNLGQLGNGGELSLLRPEALLYIPHEDGSMEFVGVEYIIPADDWPFAQAPEFLGQHLHFNEMQQLWALHVWVARDNPSGILADWNPDVNCDFAPAQ